ncbi:hypothetical protein [Streptomyces sp. CB03238]|uniref:hypothetical protein n=1 Tax=Streptomyces sp. CB03238 TaxID=1907777 RepID=UPI000A1145CD|nr:hypothetical protein [Streptomyces sp. CB03238]ORT53293.1 hypothetical protein BKD26_38715 [Streptomyces sp. CB03238]
MDNTLAVILLVGFALLLLCSVVVVAIVFFSRTADRVVERTRPEDLPRVLESVGRTLSGLVVALGRGIRQALPVGSQAGTPQPQVDPASSVAATDPRAGVVEPTGGAETGSGTEGAVL